MVAALGLTAAGSLSACEHAAVPSEPVATRVAVASQAVVIEQVGTLTTVVLRTTTPTGAPVGDVEISLTPSPTTQVRGDLTRRTDARGESRVVWDLGPRAGDVSLDVRSPALEPITVRGVLLPGPAVGLLLAVAPAAVDLATVIGQTPPVRVVDRYGNGVPGREVRVSVAKGGGTVGNPVAYSDANGDARAKGWTTGVDGYDQDLVATLRPDDGGVPVTLAVPLRGKMSWRSYTLGPTESPSRWGLRLSAVDASIDPNAPDWIALGLDLPQLIVECFANPGFPTYFNVGSVGRMVFLGPSEVWFDGVAEPVFDPTTVDKVQALARSQRMRIRFTPYRRTDAVDATFELQDLRERMRSAFPASCLAPLAL